MAMWALQGWRSAALRGAEDNKNQAQVTATVAARPGSDSVLLPEYILYAIDEISNGTMRACQL